jgi:hypothetical protein
MDKHELEGLTKDELINYADDNDIEVHQHWVKDEIIKEILKGQKTAAKHEEKFDSTKHHEERKANIKAENKANEENQEIANFTGPVKEGETRDELLARIRKMREEPPKEPPPALHRTEGIQKEYDAEVKAGQEAVAKAQETLDRTQAAWRQHEAEGEKKAR